MLQKLTFNLVAKCIKMGGGYYQGLQQSVIPTNLKRIPVRPLSPLN